MSDFQLEGECKECGTTGLIGLSCPNPDCHGVITALEPTGAPSLDENAEPQKYEDEVLNEMKEDDNVVSFESLAEEEEATESKESEYEDL